MREGGRKGERGGERGRYALRPDDSDDKHERGDDADEYTLHFGVVGYETWFAYDVRLQVVSTSYPTNKQVIVSRSSKGSEFDWHDLLASI